MNLFFIIIIFSNVSSQDPSSNSAIESPDLLPAEQVSDNHSNYHESSSQRQGSSRSQSLASSPELPKSKTPTVPLLNLDALSWDGINSHRQFSTSEQIAGASSHKASSGRSSRSSSHSASRSRSGSRSRLLSASERIDPDAIQQDPSWDSEKPLVLRRPSPSISSSSSSSKSSDDDLTTDEELRGRNRIPRHKPSTSDPRFKSSSATSPERKKTRIDESQIQSDSKPAVEPFLSLSAMASIPSTPADSSLSDVGIRDSTPVNPLAAFSSSLHGSPSPSPRGRPQDSQSRSSSSLFSSMSSGTFESLLGEVNNGKFEILDRRPQATDHGDVAQASSQDDDRDSVSTASSRSRTPSRSKSRTPSRSRSPSSLGKSSRPASKSSSRSGSGSESEEHPSLPLASEDNLESGLQPALPSSASLPSSLADSFHTAVNSFTTVGNSFHSVDSELSSAPANADSDLSGHASGEDIEKGLGGRSAVADHDHDGSSPPSTNRWGDRARNIGAGVQDYFLSKVFPHVE